MRNLEQHISKVVRKLALQLVRERESNSSSSSDSSSTKDATPETTPEAALEAPLAGGLTGSTATDITKQTENKSETDWAVTAETLQRYIGKPAFTSDRLYEDDLPVSCSEHV